MSIRTPVIRMFRPSRGEGRGRIQGQPNVATRGADLLQGFRDIVFGFVLNVNGDGIRAGIDETWHVMISLLDHQVHIERKLCLFSHHRHHHGPKRHVIDEVPVHDVAMNPISAGFLHPMHLLGEFCEIGRQDGRRDEDLRHQSKRSTLNAQRSTLK